MSMLSCSLNGCASSRSLARSMPVVLALRSSPAALRILVRRSSAYQGFSANLHTYRLNEEPANPEIDEITFSDHRIIYEHQKTEDLCRSLLVMRLCAHPAFVQHSDRLLLEATKSTSLGDTLKFLRDALRRHFSAGQVPADVWERMNLLRANGVGSILDVANVDIAAPRSALSPLLSSPTDSSSPSEAVHDLKADAFLTGINTAATLPGQGFAMMRLASLADASLFETISAALARAEAAFAEHDPGATGFVSRVSFGACLRGLGFAADPAPGTDLAAAAAADPVDYVSWLRALDLSQLAGSDAAAAAGSAPLLGGAQEAQLAALRDRIDRLVQRAELKGVKLILEEEEEAEEPLSSLQPALGHIAHQLMRQHNTLADPASACPDGARVFLTCRVADEEAARRLDRELARAALQGYTLGVKLVSDPDPDDSSSLVPYTRSLESLLGAVQAGGCEVMVGSHQRAAVEAAVALMRRLGLQPEEAPVYFGQKLGLGDSLSFTLGRHGFKVYKYCPYGDASAAHAFLVRRIQEAQRTVQSGPHEVQLMSAELWRRLVTSPAEKLVEGLGAMMR